VATFEGRDVVRACVTHGETSPADIAEVVEALEQARCYPLTQVTKIIQRL
jgi:hypothetical protein